MSRCVLKLNLNQMHLVSERDFTYSPEMNKWLYENKIWMDVRYVNWATRHIGLLFENETDAMLFKMRWL